MSNDTAWHKFRIIVTLHWIKLKVKFPCELSANIAVQDHEAPLSSSKPFSQGNIYTDFQETNQYEVKLLFGKSTKRYASKQISIIVYLKSAKSKIPAGTSNIQLSQLVRGTKRIPYHIDKCPDKDASLQVTIKMDFIQQEPYKNNKINSYHQKLMKQSNSNGKTKQFQNPSVSMFDYSSFRSERGSPKVSFKSKFKGQQSREKHNSSQKRRKFESFMEGSTPRKDSLKNLKNYKNVSDFQSQENSKDQSFYNQYTENEQSPRATHKEKQIRFHTLENAQKTESRNSIHKLNSPTSSKKYNQYSAKSPDHLQQIKQIKKQLEKQLSNAKSQIKSQSEIDTLKTKIDGLESELNQAKLQSHKSELQFQYKKQRSHQQQKQLIDLSKRLANSEINLSDAHKRVFELEKENRKLQFDLLQIRGKYQQSIEKCSAILKREGVKQHNYHQQMKSLLQKIQLSEKQKQQILVNSNQFLHQLQKRQLKHQQTLRNKEKAYFQQKNVLIRKIQTLVHSIEDESSRNSQLRDKLQSVQIQLKSSEKQKEAIKSDFNILDNQNISQRQKINSLELQNQILKQEIDSSGQVDTERKQLRRVIMQHQQQNIRLAQQTNNLKLQKQRFLCKISQLENSVKNYPTQIEQLRTAINKMKQDNANLIVQNRTLSRSQAQSNSRNNSPIKQSPQKEQLNSNSFNIEKQSQTKNWINDKKQNNSQIWQLLEQINKLKQQIIALKQTNQAEIELKNEDLRKCAQYIDSLKRRIELYNEKQSIEHQKQQQSKINQTQSQNKKIREEFQKLLSQKEQKIAFYENNMGQMEAINSQLAKQIQTISIEKQQKQSGMKCLHQQIKSLKHAMIQAMDFSKKSQLKKTSQTQQDEQHQKEVTSDIQIIKQQVILLHAQISHFSHKQTEYINSVAELQLKIKDLTQQRNFYEKNVIERDRQGQEQISKLRTQALQQINVLKEQIEALKEYIAWYQKQFQNLQENEGKKQEGIQKILQRAHSKDVLQFSKAKQPDPVQSLDLLMQSKVESERQDQDKISKFTEVNQAIENYNSNFRQLRGNINLFKDIQIKTLNHSKIIEPELIGLVERVINEFKVKMMKKLQIQQKTKRQIVSDITALQRLILQSHQAYAS